MGHLNLAERAVTKYRIMYEVKIIYILIAHVASHSLKQFEWTTCGSTLDYEELDLLTQIFHHNMAHLCHVLKSDYFPAL